MFNQPDLVKTVLKSRPADFPKSTRISEGLRPLLGDSVFLTNGAQWQAQRRIIDPAFEGGRLREVMPSMQAAANASVDRIEEGVQEFEELASYAAADVIFRTLFSIPITHDIAAEVFQEFRTYQRAQPILNIAAFIPLPRWMPRFHSRATRRSAARIRNLITELTRQRADQIAAGTAPDDLATKIMTTPDPEKGDVLNGVKWWIRWRYFSWPVMKPVHLRLLGRSTFWWKIKTCKRALLKRCRRMI